MRIAGRVVGGFAIAGVLAVTPVARADDAPGQPPAEPVRRAHASWREIYAGPFASSRLFAMPIADVVGAYQLSLSGDGSLLQKPGVLSSAGVIALGFGDLAQLEYRHTEAIGIERTTAPVPSLGVQFKLPLPEHAWAPALAVAFRLGLPRRETAAEMDVDESVTDLYVVSRLRLEGWLAGITLHGGARISSAAIAVRGSASMPPSSGATERRRTLVLPTAGAEIAMSPVTRLVGELALVPRFDLDGAVPGIRRGLLGRLGVRWALHPALILDGSVGYQIEVAGADADADPADGPRSLIAWDIRLGGEVFVPWGAVVCRALGAFCQ